MVIITLVLLGICLGSFVNAFVWRTFKQEELAEQVRQAKARRAAGKKPKKADVQSDALSSADLSITTGRSMCTHCHHELAPRDLIPVVSYLILRGRCRYCHGLIEDTPLPEILTPLLFVLSYVFWPYELAGAGLFTFVLWLVFLVAFVALTLHDLRWFWLPDKVVKPLIGLALLQVAVLAVFYEGWPAVISALFGVLIASGIFAALYYYSKGKWIGGGDVKLGIVLGLLVGGPGQAMLLLFIASLLGTLVALPLLAFGKAGRTTPLPFGPFLMLATVIVVLFGERLLAWYLGLVIS